MGRRRFGRTATARRRLRRLSPSVAGLGVLALLPGGCGYSSGEALYMLGVGRAQKVEARFRLTDGPILILVDDAAQRVDWPSAKRYLADELAQELIKKKAARRIIPRRTLDHLRRNDPNWERRGCRDVGQKAGAQQVVWIETQDFLARPQIETGGEAAYFSVAVKVISAGKMEPGSRARLWPVSPRGHMVAATLNGSDVLRLKTKDAIAAQLAKALAERIALLFYDHRLGDFES